MTNGKIVRKLLPTLLVTVYTVPGMAFAQEPAVADSMTAPGAPEKADLSAAAKQEVAQFIRQADTNRVAVNIAGGKGVHFRLLCSPTGKEGSYETVPGSEGVIGDDGMASFSFDPRSLGKDELYLKLMASDKADFSNSRMTPKPVVLEVETIQVKSRGPKERMEENFEGVRTPTAVAGVRG